MERKKFRISDALKDRVLSDREPVCLGELYDSYLALLDSDNFHKNLFYFHIENVEQHNPNKYEASDTEQTWRKIYLYGFPYGKLENDCVKTIISKYSKDIEKNEEKIEEFFSDKKFGIRAEQHTLKVCEWNKEHEWYSGKEYIELYIFFDKEMYVQFVGENDFPVLLLPEHAIYEVE